VEFLGKTTVFSVRSRVMEQVLQGNEADYGTFAVFDGKAL
jgi:hypothetical protein